MSTRDTPFEELERLFERMSRQFDEASRLWGPVGDARRLPSGTEPMAVDLLEHDDEFVATVDLPGFDREDIEIRVTDNTLRIAAEREAAAEEESDRYLRRERRHESTTRSVTLPDEVDTGNVTARMKDGVLTVTLPKLEAQEAHRIDIE
jgi:HSP20 family protein